MAGAQVTMNTEHHESITRASLWLADLPEDAVVHCRVNGVPVAKVPVEVVRESAGGDLERYIYERLGAGSYVAGAYYRGAMREHTRFMVGEVGDSRWGATRDATRAVLAAENPAPKPDRSPLEDIKTVVEILAPAREAQEQSARQEREFEHSLVLEWIRSRPTQEENTRSLVNQLELAQRLDTLMHPAGRAPGPRRERRRARPIVERVARSVTKAVRSIDPDVADDLVMRGVQFYRAVRSRQAHTQARSEAVTKRDSGLRPAWPDGLTHPLMAIPGARERIHEIARLTREGSPSDVAAEVTRWIGVVKAHVVDDDAVIAAIRQGPGKLFSAVAAFVGIPASVQDAVRAELNDVSAPDGDDAATENAEKETGRAANEPTPQDER